VWVLMKPEDKVYVIRLVMGVLMGLLSAIYSLSVIWILLVVLAGLVYAATVFILPPLVGIERSKENRRSIIMNGLGAYIAFWLMSWIFLFNILNMA